MMANCLLNSSLSGGELVPFGELLVFGGVLFFAALLYVILRDLRSTYAGQGQRLSRCRLTGREVVGRLLEHLSLHSVQIDEGAPIDHYDSQRHRVRLRTESSVSSTVAALAIAAHEVGHAEQFATGYWAARATQCLLILLMLGGGVLFVYPFAAVIGGTGDVNLTFLVALLAIFPVMRLPIAFSLERDANWRAQRLLSETKLADVTEAEGIAELLRTALRLHLAFSVGLVLLAGACVATMSLVESGLSSPMPTEVQVAVSSEFEPSGGLPSSGAINQPESVEENRYLPFMFVLSLVLVWWAFRGQGKKPRARSAVDGPLVLGQ